MGTKVDEIDAGEKGVRSDKMKGLPPFGSGADKEVRRRVQWLACFRRRCVAASQLLSVPTQATHPKAAISHQETSFGTSWSTVP